jgi:hypothetical protein
MFLLAKIKVNIFFYQIKLWRGGDNGYNEIDMGVIVGKLS